MKRTLLTLTVIAIIATAAFAQQYSRGPGGGAPGTGTPPAGPQSVISGTVLSFAATAGTGMPALVVDQNGSSVTLILGPFWFLQNAQFTAAAGDRVEAIVLACTECPTGYAVVTVKNVTTGASVTLRNANGLPLWQSGQGGPAPAYGNGPGNGHRGGGPGNGQRDCNGTGPDMTQVATFIGTVSSFAGGPGAGRPTLVLTTSAGDRTFIVAPYRAILDAGLELKPGASLTITAAPTVNQEWVVIALKDNTTGAELQLRDVQTGMPLAGRCGCC